MDVRSALADRARVPLVAALAAATVATAGTATAAPAPPVEPAPPAVAQRARTAPADAEANRVVQGTCAACHNDRALRGNLSLERFDVVDAAGHADVAERMVRKLRAGMMPPPGPRRPEPAALLNLVETLEQRLDAAAALAPDPGSRPFQRLNRSEYEQAVRDLLALDVDAGDWLPLDPVSANFDNIADAQTLSATLLEAYLNAAGAISRLAVGERGGRAVDHTYTSSEYVSQHPWDHVPGAPYGTRGGLVVDHVFPADAEYVFGLTFTSGANTRIEDIDVSIDGERVALLHYNTDRRVDADGRGGVSTATPPIFVRAGTHRVAAAFVRRQDGPYEDLIRPHDWSFAGGGSGGAGITTLPHVRDLIVSGPYNATGLSGTPSRERVFTCRPTAPAEARPCARRILARLAREAYRRTPTDGEVDDLLAFFDDGAARGGFETGVRTALDALLASPHFVLRLERAPVDAPERGYRLSDVDLASRLSFFLWGAPPGRRAAGSGRCGAAHAGRAGPAGPAHAGRSALGRPGPPASPRSGFRLQDMEKVRPDPNFFPGLRREPRAGHAPRDGAVLRRPGAGEPQPAGSLPGRLHLRRRAAGAPLRDPRRGRPPLPARGLSRRHAPRHPGPRQRARPHVARQPHVAGAAREVGDGGAARHPATPAAARHPRAWRTPRRFGTAGCSRPASGWRRTARTRVAPRATG